MMTRTDRLMTGAAAAAFALGLALGGPASAQTAPSQEHEALHPDGAPAPSTPAQPPMPDRGAPMQGMAGPGGQQGGMMGGDMGRMMQMMHRQMAAQHAMRPFEHIEGQLAFYRAELRITEAQQPQWNTFAEAVRAASGTLRQAVMQAMQQGGAAGGTVPAPQQME